MASSTTAVRFEIGKDGALAGRFKGDHELLLRRFVVDCTSKARLATCGIMIRALPLDRAIEMPHADAAFVGTVSDGARLDATMVVRSLRKSWRTTGLAIVTITVAIGATTAVYSVIDGVLLPPAPAELGWIHEYEFVVHPRLAGHGPTLFAGLSKYVNLKLVGRQEFRSGAVALRYKPR